MSVRRESREEQYDVVVIGSGVGGLTAGALLAKAGRKVLIVERHDKAGGYVHGFKRGKYFFDSAAHLIGAGEGGPINHILRLLGVYDRLTFHRLDPMYAVRYPGFHMRAPLGIPEFIEAHAQQFPHEERGLRDLFRLLTRFNRQFKALAPDVSSYESADIQEQFPLVYQYRAATSAQVLDEFLTDPRLKTVLGSTWLYLGLPLSKVAITSYSSMLVDFLHNGAYIAEGGAQRLADAFVEALEAQGGELLLRTGVRRILTQNRRVIGVMLENGQRIRAPVVVSNADVMQTFEELVGVEHLPRAYVKRLREMRPGLSGLMGYMATSLDLAAMDLEHETFLYKHWDHDETYRDLLEGRPTGLDMIVPTLADPSLAPPGEHLIITITLMPYDVTDSWRQNKEQYAAALLDRITEAIPDLKNRVTFFEGASPRTFERYTLNSAGSIYGWERAPEQSGANALSRHTPIQNLYLAGHWTQPGGGLVNVTVSGMLTARDILGYADIKDFLRALSATPAALS